MTKAEIGIARITLENIAILLLAAPFVPFALLARKLS